MFLDSRARTLASLVLLTLSGLLFVVGGVAMYARAEIVDGESFSARAAHALEDEDVRQVVADQIVAEIIDQGGAELLTVRPLVTSGVTALLDTPQFRPIFRAAVRDAHALFIERDDGGLVVDLADASPLVAEGLASVSPEIARDLPEDLRPQVAELRESNFAARVFRVAERVRILGIVLPLLSLAGFALAIALSPSRRAAVTGAGVAVASGGAAVAVALVVWRALAVESAEESGLLDADDVHGAVGAVWDAYLGDLRTWSFLAIGAGLLLVAVGGAGREPAGVSSALRALADRVLFHPATRVARAARAVTAIAFGSLLLLEPAFALQVAGLVAGGILVLFGIDELLATVERARAEPRPGATRRRLAAGAAGAAGALVLALSAVAVAAVLRDEELGERPPVPKAAEERGCNGSPDLCERRLNQVVFPATHNSFSAAAEPGWLFANQRYGVERQLRDGVRTLMIDIHVGVRAPDGQVRTDLQAEGESRNRVARRLSARALEVADRLVGRVGLGGLEGERGLYLCHTLCELGAVPLADELRRVRDFLESNRSEVVVVFVEPYVPPSEIERAFGEADLLDHVATLRRDEPLPTLGDLVRSGRRLVVFREGEDAGRPEWYHSGFSFVQDTPIRDADEGGCRPNRGDGNSPLLMLNNWVDGFPPPPRDNERIGQRDYILERVERCRELRGLTPNFIAVDFYAASDVVDVAAELNRRTPAPAE